MYFVVKSTSKKECCNEMYEASTVKSLGGKRRISPVRAEILTNVSFVAFSCHGEELYATGCAACSERKLQ